MLIKQVIALLLEVSVVFLPWSFIMAFFNGILLIVNLEDVEKASVFFGFFVFFMFLVVLGMAGQS